MVLMMFGHSKFWQWEISERQRGWRGGFLGVFPLPALLQAEKLSFHLVSSMGGWKPYDQKVRCLLSSVLQMNEIELQSKCTISSLSLLRSSKPQNCFQLSLSGLTQPCVFSYNSVSGLHGLLLHMVLAGRPHEVSFTWWLGRAVRLHHFVSHVGGFRAG